jgi:hypothetical protein
MGPASSSLRSTRVTVVWPRSQAITFGKHMVQHRRGQVARQAFSPAWRVAL